MADNTKVEWGLNGYESDGESSYLIRTSHNKSYTGRNEDTVADTNGPFSEFEMTFNMHSHPNNGMASGYSPTRYDGDMAIIESRRQRFERVNQQLPPYYIYNRSEQSLYRYTPWNPSIPFRGNMTTLKQRY